MKKNKLTFVFSLFAVTACYILLSGYKEGAANYNDYECSGAETGLGNPTGCSTGSCHSTSATSGIGVVIELDSVGVATTHYKGGMTYTVKITGTNNTSNTLPKFGFQIGSIKGATAQTTPTNAGTWNAPFPANTQYTAPVSGYFVVGVVEQNIQLAPISGTGGNGTKYSETFNWTAPATGTGTISFWLALNAVNDNGATDPGDLWNTTHLVVNEWASTSGIASIKQNSFNATVFPNPVTNYATLDYTLQESSNVQIGLYDVLGKKVDDLFDGKQNAGDYHKAISVPELNLKNGIYIIVLNDGNNAYSQKIIITK